MKIKIFALLLFTCLFAAESMAMTSNVNPSSQKKLQKKQNIAPKKRRYVSPPQDDLKIELVPLMLPISDDVIIALSKNKVDEAARTLRMEPPSAKSLYLLREAQKITKFKKNKTASYKNIGIAYHNLFLFLKRNNIINKAFYKAGIKYYKKSSRNEARLLIAALTASNGEIEKAKKIFSKIVVSTLGESSQIVEHKATYFAAIGDVENAIENIRKAHDENPDQTAIWTVISDDFLTIENDPEFKKLLKW